MIDEKEMMSIKELSSTMIEEDWGFIHGTGSGITYEGVGFADEGVMGNEFTGA